MIPPPHIAVEINAGALQRAIERRMRPLASGDAVVSVMTGGRRGADENAMIAHVQADARRNPYYIGKERLFEIRRVVKKAWESPEGITEAVLRQIGKMMIEAIEANVGAQRNKSGSPFAPLSKAYAAAKQRRFKRNLNILEATGDLIGGLRVVVARVTGGGQ
jgi:hypothetical protein